MNEVAVTPADSPFTRPVDIPRTCTDEALVEGVGLWMAGADGNLVGAKLCISPQMVGGWANKPGWHKVVAYCRTKHSVDLVNGIGRCSSLILALLEDRIVNGDLTEVVVTDEKGVSTLKQIRVPLRAWQLSSVFERLQKSGHKLTDRLMGVVDQPEGALSAKEISRGLTLLIRNQERMEGKTIEGEIERVAS